MAVVHVCVRVNGDTNPPSEGVTPLTCNVPVFSWPCQSNVALKHLHQAISSLLEKARLGTPTTLHTSAPRSPAVRSLDVFMDVEQVILNKQTINVFLHSVFY